MTALVVGVGNPMRGDDAVGPVVAARVAALGLTGVTVLADEEPLTLVELLGCYDDVVVVDATPPGTEPGRVRVCQVGPASPEEPASAVGSHGLGVLEAVGLARALGRLPRRLTVVGVEAATTTTGAPLSVPVEEHLDEAVAAVLGTLPARH